MKKPITAVIFAGGKSSRMEKDKSLLPFGGYPTLTQYQFERLRKYFDKVYISAKENKFDFDAELIHDLYEVSSPLAALVSIFETLDINEVFVLSVDAPFVDEKVIGKLVRENKEGLDTVIAQSPGGLQPLCGIYKRSLLPLAKQHLEEDRHRLTVLLKEAESQFVTFDTDRPFKNLNHPHEYEKALREL